MLQELLEMLQTLIGHGPFYRVYNQCRDRQKVLCWMVVKGIQEEGIWDGAAARACDMGLAGSMRVDEWHVKEPTLADL